MIDKFIAEELANKAFVMGFILGSLTVVAINQLSDMLVGWIIKRFGK